MTEAVRRERMDLSIIVPVFNEEDSVVPLVAAIKSAVDPLSLRYEILLVDDGSSGRGNGRARSHALYSVRG